MVTRHWLTVTANHGTAAIKTTARARTHMRRTVTYYQQQKHKHTLLQKLITTSSSSSLSSSSHGEKKSHFLFFFLDAPFSFKCSTYIFTFVFHFFFRHQQQQIIFPVRYQHTLPPFCVWISDTRMRIYTYTYLMAEGAHL